MKKLEKTEKAYSEIRSLLKKHKDLISSDLHSIENKIDCHLLGLKLKEKYGFNITPENISSTNWLDFGTHLKVSTFGEESGRKISWSDDGSQPDNEMLLYISFPTGAYIFGEDYPTDFFQEFFNELKSYNPKFTDTANKSLYYTLEDGATIFNEFPNIMKKYRELNAEDYKQRKIKEMEKELAKLKG